MGIAGAFLLALFFLTTEGATRLPAPTDTLPATTTVSATTTSSQEEPVSSFLKKIADPRSAARGPLIETGTYTTFPVPTPPSLPRAGSKGTDPTFGTEILRLTDGSNGSTRCVLQYSNWPIFNKDSTRIAVACQIEYFRPVFYEFNPDAFSWSSSQVPDVDCQLDMLWSGVDADVMYCRAGEGGALLTAYNVRTGIVTPVKDFSGELDLDAGDSLYQMGASIDDDVWTFTVRDAEGNRHKHIVWRKSTDTILHRATFPKESRLSIGVEKSGRYLMSQQPNGDWDFTDLVTGAKSTLIWGVDSFVHNDVGHGTVLAPCSKDPGLCWRTFSAPHEETLILPYVYVSAQDEAHYSLLADNEKWGLVTNSKNTGRENPPEPPCEVEYPLECEIYQVATDGSGTVRRLAHHFSTTISYDRQAFGNISRDGRFIAWMSDWGNPNGRTDVYLGRITPAP